MRQATEDLLLNNQILVGINILPDDIYENITYAPNFAIICRLDLILHPAVRSWHIIRRKYK